MRRRVLAALLLAILPLAAALADPGGADAPGAWEDALDVAPGVVAGDLRDGDDADWYRLAQPADKVVVADAALGGTAGATVDVRSDAGLRLDRVHVPAGGSARLVLDAGDGAVRLGVSSAATRGPHATYRLALELADRPDFKPAALRVEPVPVDAGRGGLVAGTQRRVEIEVANVGLGSGGGYVEAHVRSKTDGASSLVGVARLRLDAGASTVATLAWDAAGVVGDVTVTASATAYHDLDPANGAASIDHHVLVGGAGVGATAAASAWRCAGRAAHGCVDAGASRSGAFASASGEASSVFVRGAASKDMAGGGSAVACAYVILGACRSVSLP